MIHISRLIAPLGAAMLLALASCQNYDMAEYAETQDYGISRFEGTTLEYLQAGDDKLSLKYDSMLKVMDGIPGFTDLFEDTVRHTVFAIPDTCFQKAITMLNRYRSEHSLGKNVWLDDLLGEPFQVKSPVVSEIDPEDTTWVYTTYDYRAELDTLLCRYVFDDVYDAEAVQTAGGQLSVESHKYEYNMNLSSDRDAASGVVGGGVLAFTISDMNNSQQTDNWATSSVLWRDIYTTDGVVHVLDTGHEFGFGKFTSLFDNRFNELSDENDVLVEE